MAVWLRGIAWAAHTAARHARVRPQVIDGYSEVMEKVFGVDGVGSRSAVGMGSLPFDIAVEIELTLEVDTEGDTEETAAAEQALYKSFGLRPVINAMGSMTSLGGSRIHPKAIHAMRLASANFVDLNGLLRSASSRIEQLVRAPTGYSVHVCGGAAASIAHAVAACLAGTDQSAIQALPDTQGRPRDVVMDGGSDTRWQQAVKLTGARVRFVGSTGRPMRARDLKQAVNKTGPQKPVAVLVFDGGVPEGAGLPIEQVIGGFSPAGGCCLSARSGGIVPGFWREAVGGPTCLAGRVSLIPEHVPLPHAGICRPRGVPVIVDAAARLPPRSNLWKWTSKGAGEVTLEAVLEIVPC